MRWLPLVGLLWGCADAAPAVDVSRAVITMPSGDVPALVFLTVRNTGAVPLFLERLEVAQVGPVTLRTEAAHRMGGEPAPSSLRMPALEAVPRILVPAGAQLRLTPGGYTGVVEADQPALVAGEQRELTLHFERAAPVVVRAGVVLYADLETALGGEADTSDAPSAAAGARLYASDGCAACHGVQGWGDGPVARTLAPPPRDFRRADGFRNGSDVEAIAQTLATGLPGGGGMPLYPHLTLAERRSLALFVHSLRDTTLQHRAP